MNFEIFRAAKMDLEISKATIINVRLIELRLTAQTVNLVTRRKNATRNEWAKKKKTNKPETEERLSSQKTVFRQATHLI